MAEDFNLPEDTNGNVAMTAEEEKCMKEVSQRASQKAAQKAAQETQETFKKSLQARRQAAPKQVAITEEQHDAANRREDNAEDERPTKGHKHFQSNDITTKPDTNMEPLAEVTYSWDRGPTQGTEEQRIGADASGMVGH